MPTKPKSRRVKREKPLRIRMDRTLNGLSPHSPMDAEALAAYGIGAVVEIDIYQPRSLPHHRFYWAILGKCAANHDEWNTKDIIHKNIKRALKMVYEEKDFEGRVHEEVDSTDFHSMDQAEFKTFFDRAMEVLDRLFDIPRKLLWAEANKELVPLRHIQSDQQKAAIPYQRNGVPANGVDDTGEARPEAA